MSVEENKALVRRIFDEVNKRNFAAFDEIWAASATYHDPSLPDVRSREEYKQYVTQGVQAFPDAKMAIDVIVGEGDTTATRYSFTGTHKAEYMGIPPTGKQVKTTGMYFTRFAKGKIVESWANSDTLGLLQQLGVIPGPAQK